jgi:hypothetical protein
VTLLLTDGVDPAWHEPVLQGILRRWAASGPTAILQALPERLWSQTALTPEPGRFHSTEAGASNSSLKYTPYALQARPLERGEITVPVLGIEPEWLAPWARSIAGTGSFDGAGVRLPASAPPLAVDRESAPAAPHREVGFEEFLAQAHPRVFRLAAYLAATEPLNLGLMRLIQSTMLPDSPPSELAEIVFSGLLRRRPDTDEVTDALQQAYEFTPHVQKRLRSTLRRDETHAVITAVSAYVDRASPAASARFTAAVADPAGSLSIPAGAQHWAAVRRPVRATPAEVPARGVGEASRRFLITIGMSAYTGSGLPDLPSVPADINRVSEAFKGVGFLHVLPHLARDPLASNLLQDIAEWSEAELDHHDTVVIYLAGHAELHPELDDELDIVLFGGRLRAYDILTRLGDKRLNNLILILDTDFRAGRLGRLPHLPNPSNFAIMAYGMRDRARAGSPFAAALSAVLEEPRSADDGDLSFEALRSETSERLRYYTGKGATRSIDAFTSSTYADNPLITPKRQLASTTPKTRAAADVIPDRHQANVIRELVGWMREPHNDSPWIITGEPGSGKTTLFSFLADHAAQENLGKVVTLNATRRDVNGLWDDLAEQLGTPGRPAGLVMDETARSATPLVVIIDDLDQAKTNTIDGILADLVRPLEQMPSVRLVLGSNDSIALAQLLRGAKVTELGPSRAGITVLGVHGIGQQLLGEEAVLRAWRPALLDGMARSGHRDQRMSIHMAFYGDLFRPASGTLGSDTSGFETLPADGLAGELLATWAQAAVGRKIPAGANVLRFLESSRFFGEVAARMVTSDVRQVQTYLTDPAIRTAARQRVMSAISPSTRVVVAHSLGSVLAYEALCALPQHPVRALVTLGSPLGIPSVFQRLQPAPRELDGVLLAHWPGGHELKWTNIVDKDDIVASVKDLRTPFGYGVRTVLVDNGSRAHDATRYLTNPVCGGAVAVGLRA